MANPSADGRLGGAIYEGYGAGKCDCVIGEAYKFGFGPGLGVAFQINSKTVIRAGGYITNGQIVGVGYNTKLYADAFGQAGATLARGLSWTQNELFGGRPPRVNQWNISLQRPVTDHLTVEAAYVGNRAVWLQSDNMPNLNAVTLENIRGAGFDLNNAGDRSILTGTWTSAAAQTRGIRAPSAGFPTHQPAINSLRPYPQFGAITPRWSSFENGWYDSLQAKVAKRAPRGLDVSGSFTWQKPQFIGDTGGGAVNDVFNRRQNKYLSSADVPLMLTIGFTYPHPLPRASPRREDQGQPEEFQSGNTASIIQSNS